ncbi:MAG: uracil-DNA glycosylase family protein [Flavobacteriaceae bacterium]
MWEHRHPYPPFIPDGTTRILVGTLPPPRFSLGQLKPKDVDFSYGSSDGYLWPIIARIYQLDLLYDNSKQAIAQRQAFLVQERLGICDIVESCNRQKIDASDIGMQEVVLRDLFHVFSAYPAISQLIFTGGNSKNGPEYFFRQLAAKKGVRLRAVDSNVPRRHSFFWEGREITTVSLTAPSGAANRAVGSLPAYKQMKKNRPDLNTLDFRVLQYSAVFLT